MATPSKQYEQQKKYFKKDLQSYGKYEESLNAWRLSYIERIKKSLLDKDFKKKTLLDLGTGSGYIAVEMARIGVGRVLAIDITREAIKGIKKAKSQFNLKNLSGIVSSAEKLPFKSKSVDYIVANALLEHIPDEKGAIEEWKRVLKRGGKLFLVVPLKLIFVWPFLWPVHWFYDHRLGHLRRYGVEELRKKFEGMKVTKTYFTGHLAKTIWLLLSRALLFNSRASLKADSYFERLDEKSTHKQYGANNITIIFEKS